MFDFLQSRVFILENFLPNVFWADIFDILIISSLIYLILILFKQSKSSPVFFGALLISLIYLIANIFRFELTLSIFRVFFSVLLIAIIIIFQKEIRRFLEIIVFELISWWGGAGWSRYKRRRTSPEYVESIVRAAERLAQQKIGLLIVIRGRESLEYHLQGGFDLNGKISEPLLQSIFDPSTPGHDGAVIIDDNIITKFAVHLPLSEDFQQIKQYGTRHSAALGIAENTDALAVIVSEERGSIAVARDGRLKLISEAGELEKEITIFLNDKFSPKSRFNLLEANTSEKVLALLMSLLLWYVIVYQLR